VEAVDVAAGWTQTLVLTADGAILQFGWAKNMRIWLQTRKLHKRSPGLLKLLQALDKVGLSYFTPRDPEPVLLEGFGPDTKHQARSIACGSESIAVITKAGKLFTLGSNYYGQCGWDNHLKNVYHTAPTQVQELDGMEVTDVALGFQHMLVLDATGQVWVCGKANSGQLGIPVAADRSNKSRCLYLPHPLQESLKGTFGVQKDRIPGKIKQVAAGLNHSVLLDAQGKVWSFGVSSRGQLGHGDYDSQLAPKKVGGTLAREVVTAVACGQHHTVALTKNGEVFTWGMGKHGQCGVSLQNAVRASPIFETQEAKEVFTTPQRVNLRPALTDLQRKHGGKPRTIRKIYAGFFDTVAVTDQNEAIIFGGNTNPDAFHTPTALEVKGAVVAVAFGPTHAAAVTRND
jgi:alpha-tubulin suppressor-like RCC1 family protein